MDKLDVDDELVAVSLNLPRSVLAKVADLAQRQGINRTTVIRRAVDLQWFLQRVLSENGRLLVKQGDEVKEVRFE